MESLDLMKLRGVFTPQITKRDGSIIHLPPTKNIVVDVGIQHLFDSGVIGTTWYVGLMGNDTPVAGTVISDLAGNEVIAYTETVRQTWTKVRTAQTVDNTAAVATFSINVNATSVFGAFVVSNSTKGGSTGTLLAAALFTGGAKSLDNGDLLSITYSITGSSS